MATAQQLEKFKKALAKVSEVFDDLDISEIELPSIIDSEIIHEAASVIAYFDMREKFREETCRGCSKVFAYSYYFTSVKHCSVPCLRKTISSMGLTWDPNKPFHDRWGSRYVPAVVPAHVYELIKEQAPIPIEESEPAPVAISNEAIDIIAELKSLSE